MNTGSNMRIGPFEVFYPIEESAPRLRHNGDPSLPGRLFVVEGIDGSGKSTQLSLLHKWLESKGYGVVFSQWNSSELVKDTTKLGKKKKMLTPATFSLIHATDFADRLERYILPLLKAGADPNFKTPNGETPLMAAAEKGQTLAVRTLLADAADPRTEQPT